MRALIAALLLLALPAAAQPVSVLTYHRFDPAQSTSGTTVTTPVFAAQMDWLQAQHVHVLRLGEVVDAVQGKAAAITEPSVAITADDGWRTVYTQMFPIIRKRHFPVTLFLNPPTIGHGGAYLTWAQIDEMRASGLVEMQAHTETHPNFNDQHAKLSPAHYTDFVDRELAGSRNDLLARNDTAAFLAWPYGINNLALQDAAARAGFRAAFALGSRPVLVNSPIFALPRYQVYNTDNAARFAAIVAGQPRH